MPSLLDMRRRIRSVKSTQQITKAMKMVAAAKLRRAQERVVAARPFAQKMAEVLENLSARITEDFSHPLLDARADKKYLIVLVTADRGLCGAFNANLIKTAHSFMQEHQDKTFQMIPIGRKGRDFFRRRKIDFPAEYINLTAKGRAEYTDAVLIAKDLIKLFTEDKSIDKVFLIYSEFKSVLSQKNVIQQLLPIERKNLEQDKPQAEYIFEQPADEIFGRLLPKQIETQVYRAMLESVASEQGSRMTAMDSASKNAGELIEKLTLTMNRIRQATITKEIIEVVSGASAL
ncbi:MAG: ATP synthase F1 subunit gamma [Acidobacteria bacterium]|nr:MAG: ATP synthase F1 subunit gamma [Acidobacteriota bacterium]